MNSGLEIKQSVISSLSGRIREVCSLIDDELFSSISEIRVRADKPLILRTARGERIISAQGYFATIENAFKPTQADIADCMEGLSRHSLYAVKERLKNGFISLPYGHRAGIAGEAVSDGGGARLIKNVSSINLRIAREIKGCSDKLIKYVAENDAVLTTLIIGSPSSGKTTLLRDICRNLSDGLNGVIKGQNVAVADERSEISACDGGKASLDVGIRADVMDACPKAEAAMTLIRSMAPDVIIADEIGKPQDAAALEEAAVCGVSVICAAHGRNIADIQKREVLNGLIKKGIFARYVVINAEKRPLESVSVYDGNFLPIREDLCLR